MATHDYVIDNSTGANVRADINSVLQAILTNNSSSSAPSTTAAYMWWADTTSGTLKIRNSSDNAWVELLQLDGTLTLEDGSASTPALAFRDDLDTGIFQPGNNQLAISCNGTEVVEFGTSEAVFNDTGADINFRIEGDTEANLFFVDAGNNRIGIGTNSPVTDIHTVSSSDHIITHQSSSAGADVRLNFRDSGNTDQGGIHYAFNGQSMRFITSTSERMRIDSSGRLLLGTGAVSSPKGSGAGSFDLDNGNITMCIGGDSNSTGRTNSATKTNRITSPHYTNAEQPVALLSSFNESGNNTIFYGGGSSQTNAVTIHSFYTAGDTTTTSGSEKMRIDSSGRVLIGTTTEGSAQSDDLNIANSDHCGITVRSGSTKQGNLFFTDLTSGNQYQGFVQYDHSDNHLGFGTSESERFRIDSSGQIFFNCTDVTDSGSSVANNFAFSSDGNPNVVRSHSNVIYGRSSNSADRHCMQLVQHRFNRTVFLSVHTNTGITGQHLLFYQGTNVVGGISTSDSATSYSTSSDYRLKENETVISDGITRLKTLIPRRFNWKIDETNTPVDGFFAHEVTAVPEAVTGTKDQVATADDVSNEIKEGDPIYQSIDQSKLVPLITAALQEAVAKIEVLETKVAALEAA